MKDKEKERIKKELSSIPKRILKDIKKASGKRLAFEMIHNHL